MIDRIVLGSASLGSVVPQPQSLALLKQAFAAGISRVDTAPFYGAGFAPRLIARAITESGAPVRVSTKFGSFREPGWRMLAKRLRRARSAADLLPVPGPGYGNADRENPQWWRAPIQQALIGQATAPFDKAALEYLFIHFAPCAVGDDSLRTLQPLAAAQGARLGICSPPDEHLPGALTAPPALSECLQIHLSQFLRFRDRIDVAALPALWLHGLYSPLPDDPLPDLASREAACVDLAQQFPQVRYVVGIKSERSLDKLLRLGTRLA